jgi:hypothetical protein
MWYILQAVPPPNPALPAGGTSFCWRRNKDISSRQEDPQIVFPAEFSPFYHPWLDRKYIRN